MHHKVGYHAMSGEALLKAFNVNLSKGLSQNEVLIRLEKFGPNKLGKSQKKSSIIILLDQCKSLLTALLAVAALLSFVLGDISEGIAILIVISINISIGYWAESKAQRSMAALREMGRATTKVLRDGMVSTIPDTGLVPGDIIFLESGDIVTADIRLLKSNNLQCDESLLTGESVPIIKGASTLVNASPIHERTNMCFKGTTITRGSSTGVAVATGRKTELGDIALLAESATGASSPLEVRLRSLSEQLLLAVLLLTLIVTLSGVVMGRDLVLMIKTGIALAVAAIPEGLPIVATLALARGMWKLAEQHALIERLSAVETLGSVNIIFSDKTGTLTENRMTVVMLSTPDAPEENTLVKPTDIGIRALRVCSLCYTGNDPHTVSDPMERALLKASKNAGLSTFELEAQLPRISEEAFDPNVRLMATVHQDEDASLYVIKGAPENVLKVASHIALAKGDTFMTSQQKSFWLDHVTDLAKKGLRVLALAEKRRSKPDEYIFHDLVFLGLVGLEDPPRPDAAAAVREAQEAGIRVIMMTGDNAVTGKAIAESVGIAGAIKERVIEGELFEQLHQDLINSKNQILRSSVFARMTPAQKLSLVELHQQEGAVVAMTGDGVNDAPALKKADVGVAMGLRGTDVAKEAAAMILKDDSFASIVQAIEQGRVIFNNIRKFVIYLLSCNLSEVLVVVVCIVSGLPLPLLPLQILFLNLITDVFPALALGFGKGDSDILNRPPRDKSEGILMRKHWYAIIGYALMMTLTVLSAFVWALDQPNQDEHYARSIAFLTLAFGQLWHVFNMRGAKTTVTNNQIVHNLYVWGALALCTILILVSLYWPPISSVLNIISPDQKGWVIIVCASLVPLIVGQSVKGKFSM